jgi:hypothetical protein
LTIALWSKVKYLGHGFIEFDFDLHSIALQDQMARHDMSCKVALGYPLSEFVVWLIKSKVTFDCHSGN